MTRGSGPTPLLQRGDTVGVVSTGFAVRRTLLDAGVRRLRRMGYRVLLGDHVLDQEGYLAGDDDSRAGDLRAMLLHPEVRAVWFARGGYGTARILDQLPWRTLRRHSKLLVGYSDLTALFCAMTRRPGQLCLHGPVVVEMGRPGSYHGPSLRRLLAGQSTTLRLHKKQVLAGGRARGRLIGGNLTVLTHLLGTRFAPDLRDAVLFLEEVGEEAYRVDRALTHLRMAGVLRGVAAVLLGDFSVPVSRRAYPPDRPVTDLLAEALLPLGVPVIRGLPAGHVEGKWTLPLGGTAGLDTARGELRFAP